MKVFDETERRHRRAKYEAALAICAAFFVSRNVGLLEYREISIPLLVGIAAIGILSLADGLDFGHSGPRKEKREPMAQRARSRPAADEDNDFVYDTLPDQW